MSISRGRRSFKKLKAFSRFKIQDSFCPKGKVGLSRKEIKMIKNPEN